MYTPPPTPPRGRISLIALAAAAALVPQGAWALSLVQAPPGSQQPYVAPNVIISVDDSGSMGWRLNSSSTGTSSITAPKPDGTWDPAAPRINILKHALTQVFNDTTLLPDKKIRLAWQAMWNNGNAPGVGPRKKNGNNWQGNAGATSVNSAGSGANSMKVLQSAHRTEFLKFVNSLKASGNTPSHWMFEQADKYMREQPLDINSPWASDPGITAEPFLACRRNYHIMMTDGRWNSSPSGGSQDNNTVNKTLPDGTVYGSTSAATRPNNKLYSDTVSNTLADWAFRSWADPLKTTGLTGTMSATAAYLKAPATESFGNDSAGNPASLDRFWNPRYNPATWAHMVTYTIGFSADAVTWPGASTIVAPTAKVPFGYDGSFPDLITGNRTWPTMGSEDRRALDLWHAALNGRGNFYAVNAAADLEKAFRDIFDQIGKLVEPGTGSTAASGASITRNEVGLFTASYNPKDAWKGYVTAQQVLKNGDIVSLPGWAGQNTANKLDASSFSVSNRVVLTWNDTWVGSPAPGGAKGGTPFKWTSDDSNLSAAQKLWLQRNPTDNTDQGATKGQQRLDFIRGDRSLEGSETTGYTTAKPFRERVSRQGDIINSDIWYVGAPASNYALKGYLDFTNARKSRTAMIYVGGNDGMLHGFSAADGSELLAYVPRGVIPTLNQLTNPAYNSAHRYFVDGSPMTGDIDLGMTPGGNDDESAYTPNWRTMLVGTLGAGGKGYFVLDVTDPSAFSEINASSVVRLDRTRGSTEPAPACAAIVDAAEKNACNRAVQQDADIGHITVKPVRDEANTARATQIARMNNNRWAVVLGNGINSTNQRPVLIVQYLDGARDLRLIPATNDSAGTGYATDNGLASPRLVDLNGDGRPDVVYAGDNQGNMWKFDLTSSDDSQWQVAFGGTANVATPDYGVRGNPAGAKPLFTTRGPASLTSSTRPKAQPITAAPTVRANDRMKNVGTPTSPILRAVGGTMVAFGTGRNLAENDAENQDVQTLYSVLDNTRYKYRTPAPTMGRRLEVHSGGGTCPNGADCVPAPAALGTMGNTGNLTGGGQLAKQTITDVGTDFGTVDAVQALNQSTWNTYQGWYLDLPGVGERVLKPIDLFDGSNILTVYSQVPGRGSDVDPNIESCNITNVFNERQFRTLINIMDGKRPTVQLVDMNGDNLYNAADAGVSRREVAAGSHTVVTQGKNVLDIDVKNQKERLARMPEQSLRPSWRQVK